MGKILCATRGGEEGEDTRAGAIALAREIGDELVFLYVVDTSFLDRIAAAVVVDVEEELERMGRFQLALACEQAAAQGVEAQALVRSGELEEQLIAAAQDVSATLIVLGRPQEKAPVFDHEGMESLAGHLEEATGAEVRVL